MINLDGSGYFDDAFNHCPGLFYGIFRATIIADKVITGFGKFGPVAQFTLKFHQGSTGPI